MWQTMEEVLMAGGDAYDLGKDNKIMLNICGLILKKLASVVLDFWTNAFQNR